jgi:replicative DNA helicase Mcm
MMTGNDNGAGAEEQQQVDLVEFVNEYSSSTEHDTIISQILEAISFKDPSKIFTFHIDYNTLLSEMKTFIMGLNDFDTFSKQFTEAVKTVVFKKDRTFYDKIVDLNIKVRFKNFLYDSEKNEFPNLIPIRSINHHCMGKYICFRGVIRNIITSQMNVMKQKFKCLSCDNIMELDFNNLDTNFDGKKCTNIECESTNLEMQEIIGGITASQTLVIEELTNDSADSDTSNVSVIVDGDLVNKFNLGDTVVVTGNIRLDVYQDDVINQFKKKINDMKIYRYLSELGGSTNGLKTNFFIEANYIQKINETNILFNVVTEEEKKQIEALRTDPHVIDKLVQSFAPDIYGHELEKEVLLYQLVGGSGRSRDPTLDKRSEINVFLIGDSATAKTELMKFSLGVSYKCRKVYAGNMTRAGLCGGADQTVGGNWVLTAGAAVVADRGLLGIDELGHAPPDGIQPLNEIMEDQVTTITKIKAGSFNTRVAVLACANPPDGNRYNKRKTFMENLGINISLFTRFDFIGLFRDIPGEKDEKIAEKILNSYKKSNIAPVGRELLAKYVHFMKNQPFTPQFNEEAEIEYKHYYKKIRMMDVNENAKNPDEQEQVSITARQLPSLHRFATARAILKGLKEVGVDEVKHSEKIMDHQLNTMGIDPDTGKIDASILSGSKSTSQMNREDTFFKLLEGMAFSFKNKIPYEQFINEIRKQSKWTPQEMTEKAFGNYMRKYEEQSYFIVVNDNISLTNYNVSNPNHRT